MNKDKLRDVALNLFPEALTHEQNHVVDCVVNAIHKELKKRQNLKQQIVDYFEKEKEIIFKEIDNSSEHFVRVKINVTITVFDESSSIEKETIRSSNDMS